MTVRGRTPKTDLTAYRIDSILAARSESMNGLTFREAGSLLEGWRTKTGASAVVESK
jgi:hypothetical protein